MNSRLVWIVVAAGIGITIVGVALAGSLGSDPTVVDSALVGEPAPAIELARFDGDGSVSTADFAGDVVVVNFWASWCTGCRVEHDALLSASDDYADAGVTFLGINSQDEHGAAVAFLDELGRGEHYEYAVDDRSRAAFAYGVHGMPETFFIDRDGVVVGRVVGPVTAELLSTTLDGLLIGAS